jgi:hypothetical protein
MDQRLAQKRVGNSSGRRRGKRSDLPLVDLSNCKYEVLRIVLRKNGWEEGQEDDKRCHLIWTGSIQMLVIILSSLLHFERKIILQSICIIKIYYNKLI